MEKRKELTLNEYQKQAMTTCMPSSEKEKWRRFIEGYEVSNFGRVRSLDRSIVRKNGWQQTFKGRILKPYTKGKYDSVVLSIAGEYKTFYIHRLVAMMFVPNPHGFDEVNHLDENSKNNNAENLSWCLHIDNLNYGSHNKKISIANSKAVVGVNDNGEEVRFPSITDAAQYFGVSIQAIYNSIKKNINSCNYKWRYNYGDE